MKKMRKRTPMAALYNPELYHPVDLPTMGGREHMTEMLHPGSPFAPYDLAHERTWAYSD